LDFSGKLSKIYKKLVWRLRILTAGNRVLPNFLIIGGAKCGTTSLYGYLVQHPNIMELYDNRKEINYLDRKLSKGLNWYKGHFPARNEIKELENHLGCKVLVGEATTSYIYHPNAPQLVKELMPDVKIIAVLRNPIDRAYSQYHHEFRKRREQLTFEEAIDMEPRRLDGEYEKIIADKYYHSEERHDHSYLDRGKYAEQLDRWFQYFSRERFLILKSEDLFQNPAPIYKKVLDFLGLPDYQGICFEKLNAGKYTDMSSELRARLADYFKEPNQKLYELLETDFGWDA